MYCSTTSRQAKCFHQAPTCSGAGALLQSCMRRVLVACASKHINVYIPPMSTCSTTQCNKHTRKIRLRVSSAPESSTASYSQWLAHVIRSLLTPPPALLPSVPLPKCWQHLGAALCKLSIIDPATKPPPDLRVIWATRAGTLHTNHTTIHHNEAVLHDVCCATLCFLHAMSSSIQQIFPPPTSHGTPT